MIASVSKAAGTRHEQKQLRRKRIEDSGGSEPEN